MTQVQIIQTAQSYLAKHLNCSSEMLEQEGINFVLQKKEKSPFLEVATMGKAVIISASPEIMLDVKKAMTGKSRDELFECPLVYGQTICYLPDIMAMQELRYDTGLSFQMLQGDAVSKLRGISGFENSLGFDAYGNTPTHIVLYAEQDGKIAALAGASEADENMWEIGVDVLPDFRRNGLASQLVHQLAKEIMRWDIVPFYSVSVTNIASQRTAYRSGFLPYWVQSYRTSLDGSSSYSNFLNLSFR